jgi:hypothetical protein
VPQHSGLLNLSNWFWGKSRYLTIDQSIQLIYEALFTSAVVKCFTVEIKEPAEVIRKKWLVKNLEEPGSDINIF